jgi:hypothetical protein
MGVRLLAGGGFLLSSLRLALLVASAQTQTKHSHEHPPSASHSLPSTPRVFVDENARNKESGLTQRIPDAGVRSHDNLNKIFLMKECP